MSKQKELPNGSSFLQKRHCGCALVSIDSFCTICYHKAGFAVCTPDLQIGYLTLFMDWWVNTQIYRTGGLANEKIAFSICCNTVSIDTDCCGNHQSADHDRIT